MEKTLPVAWMDKKNSSYNSAMDKDKDKDKPASNRSRQ